MLRIVVAVYKYIISYDIMNVKISDRYFCKGARILYCANKGKKKRPSSDDRLPCVKATEKIFFGDCIKSRTLSSTNWNLSLLNQVIFNVFFNNFTHCLRLTQITVSVVVRNIR